MAITKEFKELARMAAHRTAPENYSVQDVDTSFREELATYCSSINQFMKNRYDLYEIISENADDIAPAKVIEAMGMFAEVRHVKQGERAVFKMSNAASKMRAKKFLTRVGLSGVYESFRLDSSTFEVTAHAVGEAVSIDFERMLDNADSLAELMDVLTEGMTDSAYVEIAQALSTAVGNQSVASQLPASNVVIGQYKSDDLFKLCNIAKAYGHGKAAIFATPDFIYAMGPDAIVPAVSGAQAIYHPQDIDSIHNTGRISLFRGVPIIEMPQSFVDTNNDKVWIDPQVAYVLPTGGEKIVKVVFEGDTQIYDRQNADQSIEVNAYKKVGVGIETFHNWCAYRNTDIPNNAFNPYQGLN